MFNSPLILSPSFPLLRKIESRRVFPSATTVTIYLPMSVPCSVSSPVTIDKFNGVRKRTVLFLMHQNPSPLPTQGHCSSNSPISLPALTNSLTTGSSLTDYKQKQKKTLLILLPSPTTPSFFSEISVFINPLKYSVLDLIDLLATFDGQSLLSS